jgi:peptidoglycan/LPS O-acetylase OafA/YrhL
LEVQFYLTYLLILVAGHYAKKAGRQVVVLAVATVAGWSFMNWLQQPTPDFTGRSWTFFLGVALYGALTRGVPVSIVAVPLTALGALFVWKQELHSIVTVATAAAIYTVGVTGRLSTLLAYRPLLHLGKISYSIYLLHMVIGLNLLSQLAPAIGDNRAAAWGAGVLAVVLSLGGSELLHRWVEAPANRLSQRLKRRRPTPATLTVSAGELSDA